MTPLSVAVAMAIVAAVYLAWYMPLWIAASNAWTQVPGMPRREANVRFRLALIEALPRPLWEAGLMTAYVAVILWWARSGLPLTSTAATTVAIASVAVPLAGYLLLRKAAPRVRAVVGTSVGLLTLLFGVASLLWFIHTDYLLPLPWFFLVAAAFFGGQSMVVHAIAPAPPPMDRPIDVRRLDVADLLGQTALLLFPLMIGGALLAWIARSAWPLLAIVPGLLAGLAATMLHRSRVGWVFLPFAVAAMFVVPPIGTIQAARTLWAMRRADKGIRTPSTRPTGRTRNPYP